MSNLMKNEIAIASKWWADQLRYSTKQDNGDEKNQELLNFLVSGFPATPAHLADEFEQKLHSLLTQIFLEPDRSRRPFYWPGYLDCDYSPCQILREAATCADVRADCPPFPMKTIMRIKEGAVSVRHGYNGKWQDLYPGTGDEGT